MDYPMWPGNEHPPVVLNATARPRHRPRLSTDYAGRGPRYYMGPNGELLVPAAGAAVGVPHRSASVSAPRPPANIIINNDQFHDEYERRPSRGQYIMVDGGGSRARSRTRSHSRSRYSPGYEEDYETRRKLERLRELERKDEEEKREKKIKEKLLMARAKEDEEAREREEEEKELKKKAVEEWKAEQVIKKAKDEKKQKEEEEAFEERTRQMLWRNGYTDTQINRMLKKDKHRHGGEGGGDSGEGSAKDTRIIALNRPTYIRVKAKHLDPETLDRYQLPWEWDDEDVSFIIIKKWVNERDQEILFEHTRKLRETKQLTYTTTELRREHDQLLLVKKKDRKKSPAKRSWVLT